MRSLVRIATLAANTVREAVRNRVLYTLVFFAVLLIGTGVLLSTLSYVEQERILQDVGLAAIRIWLDQFWDEALVAFQAELEKEDSHK